MEEDYTIDREGLYGFDDLGGGGEHVGTPEVQQRRDLSEEDMARLPDPSVIFLNALDVDAATLQQLIKWKSFIVHPNPPSPVLNCKKTTIFIFQALFYSLEGIYRLGKSIYETVTIAFQNR